MLLGRLKQGNAYSCFRYVCWMAYLLRYDEESGEMVPKPLQGAPFSHYYAQDVSDEGIIMETDVGVKEVTL